MHAELSIGKKTYAGLFLVTLATLMYELLLTRIFSVTMYYHYAFVAVSVALFGMTVGALLVYLFPGYFATQRVKRHLALSALCFGGTIVISFLTQLSIPIVVASSLVFVYALFLTFVVISIPFVCSGICVSLALTRFPQHVSKLYAVDLAGAATGCILLIYALRITDGPTTVVLVSLIASLGAVLFATDGAPGPLARVAVLSSLAIAFVLAVNMVAVARGYPLLRIIWVKGGVEARPIYEKWNSFSRVRVYGDPNTPGAPLGWGLSPTYPSDRTIKQLNMDIDASASTVITAFDGDLGPLEYLKFDVTGLVHYLRHGARVLVIGSGGGRDVLSALVFGQKSVVAVEINRDLLAALNRRFGGFSGHLDRDHRVTFINDEARSYIARQRSHFDLIQASLIDSWAATSAGAFVLTENSLYTVEAWKLFLERLTPNGVLTFSRWYFRDGPAEVYRLTALASAALGQVGVTDPRSHIMIVRRMDPTKAADIPEGVATILVGREPFSPQDVDTIEGVARKMQFDVVLTPRFALDSTFTALASGTNLDAFTAKFPLNIAPPTDNSPFFFQMLRLRDIFNVREWAKWQQGTQNFNIKAVFILGVLLIIVVGLTAACIIVPLMLVTERSALRGSAPLLGFFAAIGLGYLLIEISQMQRLIIFLGHPTYGLSVVLFSLLLSSGLGSYFTQGVSVAGRAGSALWPMGLLLCALVLFGIVTPNAVSAFESAPTAGRILVAAMMLFPLGVFMGMAFPVGMKAAAATFPRLTPWFWGINGATSVCASVLAIAIALTWSISAAYWTGFACYAAAFLALVLITGPKTA